MKVAGIVGMHTRARPLTLLSPVRLPSLKLGCYSSAIPVLSGTTTAVGPTGPRRWAMAAATTGGSRWHGRTSCGEPLFFEVTPPRPVRDGLAPHAVNGVFSSSLVVVSPLQTPVTPPRRQVPSVIVTFGGWLADPRRMPCGSTWRRR